MKNILLLLFLGLALASVQAQSVSSQLGVNDLYSDGSAVQASYGNVTVHQDRLLADLMSKYIQYNSNQKGFAGWRLHIYFGSGYGAKEKAEKIKEDFLALYPNIPVYILYESPNFKVHVGDFRFSEKNKAYALKTEIESLFPGSWIVADQINFPQLYPAASTENE